MQQSFWEKYYKENFIYNLVINKRFREKVSNSSRKDGKEKLVLISRCAYAK